MPENMNYGEKKMGKESLFHLFRVVEDLGRTFEQTPGRNLWL